MIAIAGKQQVPVCYSCHLEVHKDHWGNEPGPETEAKPKGSSMREPMMIDDPIYRFREGSSTNAFKMCLGFHSS